MTNQPTTALIKRPPSTTIQFERAYDQMVDRHPQPIQNQYIPQSALKLGVHVMGGPGSGKSRLLGRRFAKSALFQQQPLVVIDPTGGVIDNLFDVILRLSYHQQAALWPRIVYIDAGNSEYVVASHLYYRLSKQESLFEIANRFPSVLKRTDQELANAPILGWNPLHECAIYAGQIAAASGQQLDFVVDLIDHPKKYLGLFKKLLDAYPELSPAVEYFRELTDPNSSSIRAKRTSSFKNKLLPFLSDPALLATFADQKNTLNWKKRIKQRKTILIDLRHERDKDRLQFKMIWYLKGFMDYIKYRGMAGRGREVMLIIDEITAMLGIRTKDGHSILAEDLEELIAVLGRNYGVNSIIAHQNLSQIDERIQNVLMQMGNQLIGIVPNPDDAVRVARQFLTYRPFWIKKTEKVWHSLQEPAILQYFGGSAYPRPRVIDIHTTEFTPEEQLLLMLNRLKQLDKFQFLVQIATKEGGKRAPLQKITIQGLDPDQYPNEQILAPLRQQLAQRDGMAVASILEDIRRRQSEGGRKKLTQPTEETAILDVSSSPQPYAPANDLPINPNSTDAQPLANRAPETHGEAHEKVWQ